MTSAPALPLPADEAKRLHWRIGDVVQTSLLRYRVTRKGQGSPTDPARSIYYGPIIAARQPDGTWREVSRVDDEPLFQCGVWEAVKHGGNGAC